MSCSTESSNDLLSTPLFDVGTNPNNRASTQRNLLRELPRVHQAIDARLGQAGHFLDLRKAKELSMSKH